MEGWVQSEWRDGCRVNGGMGGWMNRWMGGRRDEWVE